MINVAEADYSFKRHKRIVPLLLQQGYDPDGWLGLILGSKLYFDFSPAKKFEDSIEALIKELKNNNIAANGMIITYNRRLSIKLCFSTS